MTHAPAMCVTLTQWIRLIRYRPFNFSSTSCLFLQSIHKVVTGRAFRRCSDMSSPHSSQIPYVPLANLSRASFIFTMSLLSLSLILSVKFRSDSREALSVGSGKLSPWPVIPLTVLFASLKSSSNLWFRNFLKYSFFFSFIIFGLSAPSESLYISNEYINVKKKPRIPPYNALL